MLQQTIKLFVTIFVTMLGGLICISILMGLALDVTIFPRDVAIFIFPLPIQFILFSTIIATAGTALLALLNFLCVRRIPYSAATNKYSSTQQGSLIIPIAVSDILAWVRQYCHDQLWRVVHEDTRQGILLIHTPPTLITWGAKVQVIVKRREDGLTEVIVESKPRLPTNIIDCGASLANVGRIIAMLQERSIMLGP